MKKDDKVVWSGPVINPFWGNWVGTIVNVDERGLIDIKWSHGPINYGCTPENYTIVEEKK